MICATETSEEHLKILQRIFNLLRDNLLEMNKGKCKFLRNKIDYLGYEVSKEGVKPKWEHIKAITNYAMPRDVHELQRFLGLCAYFTRFIKDFSKISSPLQDVLRNKE